MARKNGPTPDELEASSRYGSARAEVDDYALARSEFDTDDVLDLARTNEAEPEQQSPFLRASKRVPARRGPLPKKAANRLKIVLAAALGIAVAGSCAFAVRQYGLKSWRFRIDSSDQIQVSGNENVARSQVLDAFGGDISRNVFAVPLDERKRQLEQIPWIESVTIMRYLPNQIAVAVKERTPVAFAQVGSRIALVDSSGVIMEMPPGAVKQYSFPVLVGFTDSEPLSTRAARMKIYLGLVRDLDSDGAGYSKDLSEVDLSDPENAKITVTDGGVLVQLGDGNYLERYKIYVSHVQEWRQQLGTVKSVDVRYVPQIIVNSGMVAENASGGTQVAGDSASSSASSTPGGAAERPAYSEAEKKATVTRVAKKPAARAKTARTTKTRRHR
ncbi:MAG TPA: FtsQ-type POTRA domain-containing protein [Terriglobales bacterium]|nr:FtsQ-type POTRA domain-containing protein [Terriglobales bacterium]